MSFPKDMREVIMNPFMKKKTQRSKNVSSIRDLVAKFFIAMRDISGWSSAVPKRRCYGILPFYRPLCVLVADLYLVIGQMRRDGSSYAPVTLEGGHAAKKITLGCRGWSW
jgi:hypothetical protein